MNIEKDSLIELTKKLGKIDNELKLLQAKKQALEMEYNNIMLELWDRIPTLKEEPSMQMKRSK